MPTEAPASDKEAIPAPPALPTVHVAFLKRLDPLFKLLIWTSVALYLIELQTGSANSRVGHPAFLWIERVIASIFTLEYLVRWYLVGSRYARSPLGLIDLASILPFWIGFFVPGSWLGVVRALRVLRLLKYFRYSRSMQLVALAFYRAKYQLRSLAFAMFIVILLGTVTLHECEKGVPGSKFASLYDAFVKVALTTMNCAAVEPQTNAGKAAAMLVFLPAMAIFAGLIGVLASAFASVLDEFADPTSDPMTLFRQAKRENRRIEELEERYRK
ncbi:MAG TPA: ion transporter [Tepidisphaeraceae bacterium]|jgi:voltage-gated potassium channel|nr:ion transporter [Tepidisphaeraceae bacterium]